MKKRYILGVIVFGGIYYAGYKGGATGVALGVDYWLWSFYMGIRAAWIGGDKGYRLVSLWGALWGFFGLGWAPYLVYKNAPVTPRKGGGPPQARPLRDVYEEHYAAINAVRDVGKQPWEIVPYQAASSYPAYMVRCVGVDESDSRLYDERHALMTATARNWDIFTQARGVTGTQGWRPPRATANG